MEWIPITEQPMPKDGKTLIVTFKGNSSTYTDKIAWFSFDCNKDEPKWYYIDSDSEVSDRFLSYITAWMYYPEPYKG